MINYELKAHLKHLTLAEIEGTMCWIGTEQERQLVEENIKDFKDRV